MRFVFNFINKCSNANFSECPKTFELSKFQLHSEHRNLALENRRCKKLIRFIDFGNRYLIRFFPLVSSRYRRRGTRITRLKSLLITSHDSFYITMCGPFFSHPLCVLAWCLKRMKFECRGLVDYPCFLPCIDFYPNALTFVRIFEWKWKPRDLWPYRKFICRWMLDFVNVKMHAPLVWVGSGGDCDANAYMYLCRKNLDGLVEMFKGAFRLK